MNKGKPTLNYESRPEGSTRSITLFQLLIGLLAVVLGFFSILMLIYGIPGVAYVIINEGIRHRDRADLPGDLFEVVMMVLIGLFCGCISIRWLRGTFWCKPVAHESTDNAIRTERK